MTASDSLVLSSEQLYYLGALTGSQLLIGVRDPFYGWLTEEIIEKLKDVQVDLIRQGVLLVNGDQLVVVPQLIPYLQIIASPQVVIATSCVLDNSPTKNVIYYVAYGYVVKLQETDNGYVLSTTDLDQISREVIDLWQIPARASSVADTNQYIRLPVSILSATQDQGGKLEVDTLKKRISDCMSNATEGLRLQIDKIATVLLHAPCKCSLTVLKAEEMQWSTKGFLVLADKEHIWKVKPTDQDEEWLEIKLISFEKLVEDVAITINNTVNAVSREDRDE